MRPNYFADNRRRAPIGAFHTQMTEAAAIIRHPTSGLDTRGALKAELSGALASVADKAVTTAATLKSLRRPGQANDFAGP